MDECIKSPCVADLANELLVDGEGGRSAADMTEELVDAAGPMLAEFIGDDAIKALFEGAVAHFTGSDKKGGGGGAGTGGDGGGGDGGDGGGEGEGGGDEVMEAAAPMDWCLNLESIILAFAGKVLLRPTNLKLQKGHRYGMVGQNGAGKTTLLKRLDAGDINGYPEGLRCVFVQHEVGRGTHKRDVR